MIPKNIIQICIGKETETHRYWLHLSKKWKLDYPDWNHKVYRDREIEEIVKNYSTRAWDFYKACPILSYRADFARLILLYTFGGLYVDIDSRPNLDINQYVVNSDDMRWGFFLHINEHNDPWSIVTNNHLAAAEKESDVIHGMIEQILADFDNLDKDRELDAAEKSGFEFVKLVSTDAWGKMVQKKLDEIVGKDYVQHHISLGYGKIGVFWITYDNKEIKVRKDRNFISHVGSILIKDFMDVNVPDKPMSQIAKLYDGLTPHNGEIKIYSGGLNGV